MNFATRSTHTTLDLGLQKEKHKSHVNDKTLMKEARLRIFAIDYFYFYFVVRKHYNAHHYTWKHYHFDFLILKILAEFNT
jgi:hypothetical protein